MITLKTLKTGLLAGALAFSAGIPVALSGPEDNSLVLSMYDAMESVDFYLYQQRAIRVLGPLLEDTLFAYNPDTDEIVPSLAQSYEMVDDVTIDIELREGVVFHDSSPFTADDVVYSFEAGMQPAMSNTTIQQRVGVWLDSVEKTGPMSVRLHMSYPYAFPTFDLAHHMVVRQVDSLSEDGTPATEINGLGPYRLVSYGAQDIVLERFEDYFEGGPKSGATLDTIRIRHIPDWGTVQAELMSGGIDLAFDVPLDVAEGMGTVPGIDHRSSNTHGVVYIAMDPEETIAGAPNPLSEVLVRRGINHAVNKESIVENLFGGVRMVIDTPCHPEQFGCAQDVAAYPYDPERARELFAEAGFPEGFNLRVWAGRERDMVESISNDLINAGVDVDLRYSNMATVDAAREDGQVAFLVNTWGNTANPDIWATLINYFGMGASRSLVDDPELEALIQAVQSTTTLQEREEAFAAATHYIAEQAYWVPLMTVSLSYLAKSELDFTPPTDGGPPLLYRASWQ